MAATRVEVRPELLRWARHRSGRPHQEIADKFPQLPDWEGGGRLPTLKQIHDFAAYTYTPLSFLFLTSVPDEERPIADFRTLTGDEPKRFSPHLLDTIYRCEWQQEWYKDHQMAMSEDSVSFVGVASASDSPEEAAAHLRTELSFDPTFDSSIQRWDGAARALQRNLEAAGVLVMQSGVVGNNTRRKLDPDEFRGFSLANHIAPLIFINGRDTVAAQIFTTAHELGHLYRGETGISSAEARTLEGSAEEQWCNSFAAEFLVPEDKLKRESIGSADLNYEVKRLTQHFRVSSLVILRRLYELGFLTRDVFQATYSRERDAAIAKSLTRRSESSGGNFYNTLTRRVGRRFARAVIASVLEGQTQYTEGFDLLGVTKNETFFKFAKHLGFQV